MILTVIWFPFFQQFKYYLFFLRSHWMFPCVLSQHAWYRVFTKYLAKAETVISGIVGLKYFSKFAQKPQLKLFIMHEIGISRKTSAGLKGPHFYKQQRIFYDSYCFTPIKEQIYFAKCLQKGWTFLSCNGVFLYPKQKIVCESEDDQRPKMTYVQQFYFYCYYFFNSAFSFLPMSCDAHASHFIQLELINHLPDVFLKWKWLLCRTAIYKHIMSGHGIFIFTLSRWWRIRARSRTYPSLLLWLAGWRWRDGRTCRIGSGLIRCLVGLVVLQIEWCDRWRQKIRSLELGRRPDPQPCICHFPRQRRTARFNWDGIAAGCWVPRCCRSHAISFPTHSWPVMARETVQISWMPFFQEEVLIPLPESLIEAHP